MILHLSCWLVSCLYAIDGFTCRTLKTGRQRHFGLKNVRKVDSGLISILVVMTELLHRNKCKQTDSQETNMDDKN